MYHQRVSGRDYLEFLVRVITTTTITCRFATSCSMAWSPPQPWREAWLSYVIEAMPIWGDLWAVGHATWNSRITLHHGHYPLLSYSPCIHVTGLSSSSFVYSNMHTKTAFSISCMLPGDANVTFQCVSGQAHIHRIAKNT